MRTAEQWRSLATTAIIALLNAEGAVTQRGMEAKLSDSRYPGTESSIRPHHLTTARNRLLAAGTIESLREVTKGGSTVVTFMMAEPTKAVLRIAARKRLLDARYRSWSKDGEWGAAPIPAALERVIHNSLLSAAPHGYRLLRPEGGEVRQIAGQAVPGGPVDNAVFYTPIGADGLPAGAILLPIEAKICGNGSTPAPKSCTSCWRRGRGCTVSSRSYRSSRSWSVAVSSSTPAGWPSSWGFTSLRLGGNTSGRR